MKRFSLWLLVITIGACSNNSINDAQEVFNTFTQIKAGLDVGVNNTTYTNNVIAAKVALEKYKSSGKVNPSALPLFEKAIDGNVVAAAYWECGIKYNAGTAPQSLWRCQDEQFFKIISIYPDINQDPLVIAALANPNKLEGYTTINLNQILFLRIIWLRTDASVSLARKAFEYK